MCNVMVTLILSFDLAVVTYSVVGYISETIRCRKLILCRDICLGVHSM